MEDAPDTTCRMSLFFLDFAGLSLFGISEHVVQFGEIFLPVLGSLCSTAASLPIAEIFIGVMNLRRSAQPQGQDSFQADLRLAWCLRSSRASAPTAEQSCSHLCS